MKYSGTDKLDCLIQLAYLHCGTKDAELFDETDGSEVAVPKRLDRKINRIIEKRSRKRTVSKTKQVMGRVAIAAMLAMSIMFILLISVSGVREAIWKAIVEWHDNYITIRYEDPDKDNKGQNIGDSDTAETEDSSDEVESTENSTNESMEDKKPITPPTRIEEIRKPSYVMDGVVEDAFSNNTCVNIDYILGNDILYSFGQFVINENQNYFDNESASVETIYINEYIANLVIHTDNSSDMSIIWNDGEYVYILFSSVIDADQMIAIAESVRAE